MDLIPDPTKANPYHAARVPQNIKMTNAEANMLSSLFSWIASRWN